MKTYELTLVLDGKASSAKKKASIEKVTKLIELLGGKVLKTDDWGVKPLAYEINKIATGIYLMLDVELPPEGAKSLNEKLRLEEDIIRYLLVTKPAKLIRIKNNPKASQTEVPAVLLEESNEQKS